MSVIGVGMDLLLAVLLVAALGFGFRLERKLKALKNGQESFAQAVRELDGAARRAEAGLASLRAATDEAHDSLHDRILKARELKQQLDAQIARAERMPAPAPVERPSAREAIAALQNLPPAPELERPRPAAFRQSPVAAPRPDRAVARRFDEDLFDNGDPLPRSYS
ncbi:MAG: flagellar positioning protein PflI [Caulobacteraceae bacterium]|nr:flagellar positioning protein PflI [Caulobacteraceae bacterium]